MGLLGTGITLLDKNASSVFVQQDGSFTLPNGLANGSTYAVTVSVQPESPSQTCTASNGAGTIQSAPVNRILHLHRRQDRFKVFDDAVAHPTLPLPYQGDWIEWGAGGMNLYSFENQGSGFTMWGYAVTPSGTTLSNATTQCLSANPLFPLPWSTNSEWQVRLCTETPAWSGTRQREQSSESSR